MKSAVRSPAFRPQASAADQFRYAKRFRLKAGLRTNFPQEELDNALFNQQKKRRIERDRSYIARGHVSDNHDGACYRRAVALQWRSSSEQDQTHSRRNGHWRGRRRVDWREERRAHRRRRGLRRGLWRLQIQKAQIQKAIPLLIGESRV